MSKLNKLMTKPPIWFSSVLVVALLWNILGLLAVIADVRLSAADIAALPAQQQALYAARPMWSVLASVVAVVGGTLGCAALLFRRKWAVLLLYASLVGVVIQDTGIFIIAGGAKLGGVPFVLQGLVFLIAVFLIVLAHHASRTSWLA